MQENGFLAMFRSIYSESCKKFIEEINTRFEDSHSITYLKAPDASEALKDAAFVLGMPTPPFTSKYKSIANKIYLREYRKEMRRKMEEGRSFD